MLVLINIASLGSGTIAFANRHCCCVSLMAKFIFLRPQSIRKSKCKQWTSFLPSTRGHNILIMVFIVKIECLMTKMRNYIII